MSVHRIYFTPESRTNFSGCKWAADQSGYLGDAPKRQSQRFISFQVLNPSRSVIRKYFRDKLTHHTCSFRLKILRGRCKPQQAATSGHTVNTCLPEVVLQCL